MTSIRFETGEWLLVRYYLLCYIITIRQAINPLVIRLCLFEPNRVFCLIPISKFRVRNKKSASVVECGFWADFGAKPTLGNGNDINGRA
ncbi:hypothetical protein AUP42_03085 [Thalassospira lucentensis]|uniref:Uncharacterized protein n=1 Tax=Thalassospira lucentensis TaxID=168935 RepID=A0A154L2B2_9PROT|nr:hypothetical protein AUP42_03085 [Thalassospira lucentensis]